MNDDPVWIDGAFGGGIDPRDRGLTLGDGVFDTLVAFQGTPFAADRHLRRLADQAAAIGIALDENAVRQGWSAVLGRCDAEHVILRTTVTRGRSGRGLWPGALLRSTLIVAATPWSPALVGAPLRLVTSTIPRNPASPSSRLKTLGYLDNVLAAREAAEKGADEALFLTPSGHVACGTIANVFIVGGNTLATPPLDDGAQPGIMRALVLEAASAAGLRGEERSLTRAELQAADAVFLTNSVRFLSMAVHLDGAPLRNRGAEAIGALRAGIADQVLAECGFGIPPAGAP